MLGYRLIVAPVLLCFGQFAQAGEIDAPAAGSNRQSEWFQTESPDGLVSNFPTVPRGELFRQLKELRADLKARKANLAAAQEDGRFDAKDALITLVMPGGLLYAAYRQQRHNRIEAQEGRVSTQLEELKADLLAFRVISADTLVASVE